MPKIEKQPIETKLSQWGNSKAVRIPAKLLAQIGAQPNDQFMIEVKNQTLVLTPKVKRPTTIHELYEEWQDDQIRDTELDWGSEKGSEFKW